MCEDSIAPEISSAMLRNLSAVMGKLSSNDRYRSVIHRGQVQRGREGVRKFQWTCVRSESAAGAGTPKPGESFEGYGGRERVPLFRNCSVLRHQAIANVDAVM